MASSLTTLSMRRRLSSSVIRTFHCGASAMRAQTQRRRGGAYVAAGRVADGVEDHWAGRQCQRCSSGWERGVVAQSRWMSMRETAMVDEARGAAAGEAGGPIARRCTGRGCAGGAREMQELEGCRSADSAGEDGDGCKEWQAAQGGRGRVSCFAVELEAAPHRPPGRCTHCASVAWLGTASRPQPRHFSRHRSRRPPCTRSAA